MSRLAESINLRAPVGTVAAIEEVARREGKRPAEVIREAVARHLASADFSRSNERAAA